MSFVLSFAVIQPSCRHHETAFFREAMKKQPSSRGFSTSILLGTAIVVWLPMHLSGMIDNGDWHLHWFRLEGFSQSLVEGVWRPYWHADANSGYGAPTFLFYPPLSYYLASIPILLGSSMSTAWSAVYLTTIVVAAFGSYRLFRLWSGAGVSAAASALWTCSPPLLLKIYQIHMPASALAIAFIPWLLSAVMSSNQGRINRILTVAVTSALLILAHPMIAVQASVIMAILGAFRALRGDARAVLQALAGGALGSLLSIWYWLPLLLFRDLVQWEFLLNPAWLWEYNVLFSRPEPPYGAFHDFRALFDGLAVVGFVIAISCYAVVLSGGEGIKGTGAPLLIAVVVCLYIMSPAGVWLAELFPPMGYLMFAWRWLGVMWLLVLWLLALAVEMLWCRLTLWSRRRRILALSVPAVAIAGMVIVSLAIVGFGPLSENWGLVSQRVSESRAERAIRDEIWPTLEMRPTSMGDGWKKDLHKDPMPYVWVRSGDLKVRLVGRAQHRIVIDYEAERTSTIRIKHLNFPSWKARVGEKTVRIETEEGSGAMILRVPPGSKRLVLSYEGWPWISKSSD
ncbi:6-pyruvoyl-tetrahydropterin synthase-related protein [Wenzhouxiangella sediminis]|nr:6-pyruvoyl-tetrahydropterin synthase-related protein [Wenzhouxiangella sediminis]